MDETHEFNPRLREDTPDYRSFSKKNQMLLEMVHPYETLGIFLSVPAALFMASTSILLARKDRIFSSRQRGFFLGTGAVCTTITCFICGIGLRSIKQVATSPEREQMVKYLDKHDGEIWRYKYFTRPMINWIAGDAKEQEQISSRFIKPRFG